MVDANSECSQVHWYAELFFCFTTSSIVDCFARLNSAARYDPVVSSLPSSLYEGKSITSDYQYTSPLSRHAFTNGSRTRQWKNAELRRRAPDTDILNSILDGLLHWFQIRLFRRRNDVKVQEFHISLCADFEENAFFNPSLGNTAEIPLVNLRLFRHVRLGTSPVTQVVRI
jgi:hypothetical protein